VCDRTNRANTLFSGVAAGGTVLPGLIELAKQRLPSIELLEQVKDNVRRLHEAGVPIVAGSDSALR
jgi:imidazolonepropionase-like amidohydrolase